MRNPLLPSSYMPDKLRKESIVNMGDLFRECRTLKHKNAPRLIIHDGPGRVFLLLTAVSFLFRTFGSFSDFMFQVASSAHVHFCVSTYVLFIG